MRKLILALCLLGTPATACPPGFYYSDASKACVERLDQSKDNITADCRDGMESHAKHHAGACSSHGGVRQFRD